MVRFGAGEGWTVQAYRFALAPAPAQEQAMYSHAGARLFAFNTMLAAVRANLGQRAAEKTYGVTDAELTPRLGWSMPSLRREWNRRKHTVAVRDDGTPWWGENSKEAYASGCQALADALNNWSESKKGTRKGPRMGFRGSGPSGSPEVHLHHRGDQGRARPQACHVAPAGPDQDARVHPQARPPY